MSPTRLTVALSPHIHSGLKIPHLMYGVIFALMPAFAVSLYVFGLPALIITLIAVASCILCEYILQRWVLRIPVSIHDGSAALTGILLAFNLPSNLPWWMVIIGSVVAIGLAKMTFGGLGNNPFNPALVGRVFLLISFPAAMTTWPKPFDTDGITAATPLMILKEGIKAGTPASDLMATLPSTWQMFLGQMGGSIGEVSVAALLLGGLFLLGTQIISWHIPVSILGTAAVFSGIFWLIDPAHFAHPMFHLMSGGLMLGAIFMATDYVSSPMTGKGMIIYGVMIGLLTMIIRMFGAYPEGMSFAILIMNAFVPLINRYCKPHRFGE